MNRTEANETEVSSVGFEREVLQGGLSQVALRARGASPQFKLNPLYEETNDDPGSPVRSQRSSRAESGYASSLDSLSLGDRLTPPATPEVVERTFLSLSRLRSEATGSLRVKPRRSKLKPGGSLRLYKSSLLDSMW